MTLDSHNVFNTLTTRDIHPSLNMLHMRGTSYDVPHITQLANKPVYYRTCLESRFSILNTPIVFSYTLAKRSAVGLPVSTSVANVLNYNKWSQNFDKRPHHRRCFHGGMFNVTFNCISSRQRDRHCCTCTHWQTCMRCCLLAGSAEDSIIFTRWRQCAAHPTNALFLQPALVSPLNGISIRPAVFALPTHWSRPHRKGQLLGDMCQPISPCTRIIPSCICKPPKA